jgi:hypothetical protein
LSAVSIDENVYNGRHLVNAEEQMFMNKSSNKECILTLKPIVSHREFFEMGWKFSCHL